MKPIDTLQVVVSDFHSGSNYALFLDHSWKGKQTATISANSGQIEIRQHFEKYAEEVKQARKGKRVRLIVNGDSIDGDHHNSGDVCTIDMLEQSDIHIQLMTEFQKRIGWQKGDEIYYITGTDVHTKNFEEYIGREMNAVMNGDFYSWQSLELVTNGVHSLFVHHGPGAGEGPNEGNAMRNWLKNIHYNAEKDQAPAPDVVYTAHVHNPTYSTFITRERMNFRTMHGVILPSWQLKTKYAWKVAPVSRNKIGGVWHEIKADGTICVPRFSVMGY